MNDLFDPIDPTTIRPLAVDDAVDLLVLGGHPEADQGSLSLDAVLIQLLREGYLRAGVAPDGRLALARTDKPLPS